MTRRLKRFVPQKAAKKAAEVSSGIAGLATPTQNVTEVSSSDIPKITSDNITEHREEVLKGARKFIYPLAHSKRRVVVVSSLLTSAAIVAFLTYCGLALYKFYSDNTFLYRVTQVVPFPVAKTGGTYIAYENYLFQLRHYEHFYQTQVFSDLRSPEYKQQLLDYRKQALDQVVNQAYVKILANKNGVSVSDGEVDERLDAMKRSNKLGNNDKVLTDVLKNYWGWSIQDFKRSLKDVILEEKTNAKLNTDAMSLAEDIRQKLQEGGSSFSSLAKTYSVDSATRSKGGDYGSAISESDTSLPAQVLAQLFKLKEGEISVPFASISASGKPVLEIVRVNKINSSSVEAQHIQLKLNPISTYIAALKTTQPTTLLVKFD